MRQRQLPPILSIVRLGIIGYVFWQIYRMQSTFPSDNPFDAFDSTFRMVGLIFLAVFAITLLNFAYPLIAWGINKLRSRQETWTPEERFAIPTAEEPATGDQQCPGCGASLFDDSATCPWCAHTLR